MVTIRVNDKSMSVRLFPGLQQKLVKEGGHCRSRKSDLVVKAADCWSEDLDFIPDS